MVVYSQKDYIHSSQKTTFTHHVRFGIVSLDASILGLYKQKMKKFWAYHLSQIEAMFP